MWAEPLAAVAVDLDEHQFRVDVLAGDGWLVAAVLCVVNREACTGFYGTMEILDDQGGARQNLRALVLLTREALRHAQALGIQHVRTEAPTRLVPFARLMSNVQGEPIDAAGTRTHIHGELAQIRTHNLQVTDADGNVV